MRMEHIRHSKSRQLPETCEGNDHKKKEVKEKGPCVQLKHQPAPPREAYLMRTNGKERELLKPIPYVHGILGVKIKTWIVKRKKKCFISYS